ncbi:MAG TPA: M56 family metallopeptidase [Candidatus Limiplasma sp.]|nr:M56 family metallopeptidase [Candidatus Limiplasma sp.]
MRTATIYNFLLEANLMASVAILLMIIIRKFLRKPLGNRLIYCLWLLIAIRLLCPLALGNPYINALRPTYLEDQAIRPIAGQIRVRIEDAFDSLRRATRDDKSSLIYQGSLAIADGLFFGTLSKQLMRVYLYGAGVVALIFGIANVRFRRKLKVNRIERISGKLQEQYLEVCKQRKVKAIPVWFVDPLPSACLVGVFRPYIALPLTAAPQEAVHVLTHEVCHYKGKDHWFSALRLVCCIIHWFNPLVWAAAFMSRTDGELACDSRVVEPLSPEDRRNYTNTLVLAASKRYAPGVGVLATGMTMTGKKLQNRVRSILNVGHTAKWLMTVIAVLACMALVLTFFTAEKDVSAASYLEQAYGFRAVGAQPGNTLSYLPLAGALDLNTALDIALDAIQDQYGIDTQDRSNFDVNIDYQEGYWAFIFFSINDGHSYDADIATADGEVLRLDGPGNG